MTKLQAQLKEKGAIAKRKVSHRCSQIIAVRKMAAAKINPLCSRCNCLCLLGCSVKADSTYPISIHGPHCYSQANGDNHAHCQYSAHGHSDHFCTHCSCHAHYGDFPTLDTEHDNFTTPQLHCCGCYCLCTLDIPPDTCSYWIYEPPSSRGRIITAPSVYCHPHE